MGWAKRMMMEEMDRGYSSVGEKWVCAECFSDVGVIEFVRRHASYTVCSYCHKDNCEPIAVLVDDVIGFIVKSMEKEYDIPENELPYESAEGGWQGETFDTGELLIELGIIDCYGGELFDDICSAINNHRSLWCKRDAFGMREHEIAMASWGEFKSLVMHRCRFVFFRMEKKTEDPTDHWDQFIDPLGILDRIGNLINRHGLVTTLPIDTVFFRARPDATLYFNTIEELGPPPCKCARYANRMSPAGISMFYAAEDAETAIIEAWDGKTSACSTGVFSLIKECRIVNLIDLPGVPSLMKEGSEDEREDLQFLHQFTGDAARPINKSDKAHIDYTPTQVVAEYIRYLLKDTSGANVQGIMYRSARNGRKAYVFFWGHSDDKYTNPETIDKWCKLTHVTHQKLA